jgi:Immunity protein 50
MRQHQLPAELSGKDGVVQSLGRWPNFADAEIIRLTLNREGESVLRIRTAEPNTPAAVVDFVLEGIADLELADFSVQNVISSLGIAQNARKDGEQVLRLTLGACFGLSGWIEAKRIRVQLAAGNPT